MNIKRFFAWSLAILLTLCLIPTAFADVIFEPLSSFYEKHREEMRYTDKVYVAKDTANGYESPEDDDVLLTASDNARLYISFAYTDENGVEWGVYEWDGTSCWFRLDDLEPVYDTRDFILDHEPEFTEYADQLAELPLDGGEMPLWKYPGSQERSGSVYLDEYFEHATYAHYVYTDFSGREWVYFPYVFGMEGWANAADPLSADPVVFDANASAETPAATEAPATEATIAPTPTAEPEPTLEPTQESAPGSISSASKVGTIVLIVIAVLAVGFVMVLSIVLIVVIYLLNKKKKK